MGINVIGWGTGWLIGDLIYKMLLSDNGGVPYPYNVLITVAFLITGLTMFTIEEYRKWK